ncbi:MAG: leucyl aminopeptidase [Alphaproteobacteria bacterium]
MISVNFKGFTDFENVDFKEGALALAATKSSAKDHSFALYDGIDQRFGGALKRVIAVSPFDGKEGEIVNCPAPGAVNGAQISQVLCVGVTGTEAYQGQEFINAWQNIGGKLGKAASKLRIKEVHMVMDASAILMKDQTINNVDFQAKIAAEFAFGLTLGQYYFDKYMTQKKESEKPSLKKLVIHVPEAQLSTANAHWDQLQGLAEAVIFTRNIVSEPANIIHPESLAQHCKALSELGLKVTIFGEAKLSELGFNAMLGVGQGSVRESQLVIMEWKGGAQDEAPVALIGKGVTFDSGGISIKPSGGMEDMKWDMGGSAAVIGTMIATAKRKAKANIIGIVALVENMPDGNAQRPGDVVKSLSGQTIEVINTDAEGRLILADALYYAEREYKPKIMIDLATLTGAILVALGHEYGGMFSSDDQLAGDLYKAGVDTGELLWRMPMGKEYDRAMNSEIADMRNTSTGGRGAGSITAAQFLKRFVKTKNWAHLDIAGMAWNGRERPIVPKGGAGFGVRLLDHYLRTHHG